ncbi:MAG TPA: zinc-dependent metalloprotease, partial [Candidatus Aquilonibacter sp.]
MPLGSLVLAAAIAASPSPAAIPGMIHFPITVETYSTFVTGAKRQHGLFDVLTKDDQVYFDLGPDDLNKTFVLEAGIARGVGPEAFTGRALDSMPIVFVRHDNRIFWEVPNANFVVPSDPAAKTALDESISDSVVGSTPILAEDKTTKRIVIAPTPLIGDFEHVVALLNPRGPSLPAALILLGGGGGYSLDGGETYALGAKAFPTNVDLLVNLGLNAPESAPPSIADPRGFRIVMHYSFVTLPADDGYVPRAADDRVGYFDDTLKNLADTRAASPFVRYITRWDIRRKPIVFYLTNEIPKAYRNSVRRGILAWNAAFERIGIHDAIEVRDQPSDPAFDPDDARYSTVRWITSDTPGFGAYTGFYSDPYTGQIFRAEIVIDGEYLRTVRNGYQNDVIPALTEDDDLSATAAQQAGFSAVAARTLGYRIDANQFVNQFVEAAVMHESGHAFGLRHNFEGSAYYSLAQINDPAFTASHGFSASVMDYLPVNITPPNVRQGAYFQLALGPYDYWAIRYGYAQGVDPRTVARMSAQRAYRYGTDEDGTPLGADPLIAPFDLSSDPLGYDAEQFALTSHVLATLDARFARERRSYYDERLAFLSALQNELRTAMLATRYIGGEYTSRTHRGQPGAEPPFTAIARAQSRRAFELLAHTIFAPHAYAFPSALIRDLGPDYFHGWGVNAPLRSDFPVVRVSGALEDAVLDHLFSTENLARIYDIEDGTRPGATMRLGDLFEWTRAAAFAELPTHANAASEAHR